MKSISLIRFGGRRLGLHKTGPLRWVGSVLFLLPWVVFQTAPANIIVADHRAQPPSLQTKQTHQINQAPQVDQAHQINRASQAHQTNRVSQAHQVNPLYQTHQPDKSPHTSTQTQCGLYPISAFLGDWYTYDGSHSHPRSIIRIESQHHLLVGKIIKSFPTPGHPETHCTACYGTRYNQPLAGLTVLWQRQARRGRLFVNLHRSYRRCHCQILNPDDGRIYTCLLELTPNGKRLRTLTTSGQHTHHELIQQYDLLLHAYIGMPLFGRTVRWRHV